MKKVYLKNHKFDPLYEDHRSTYILRKGVFPASIIALGLFIFLYRVVLPNIPKAVGLGKFEFKELQTVPTDVLGAQVENVPEFFYLSVPALGIKEAKVETNAKTLNPDKALGHYPGTALPGEIGTSFIFGHSVLPIFYSPKNYKSIFSTIGKLKKGDDIYISYNNTDFHYRVTGRKELSPEDVDPLYVVTPRYLSTSNLVLMTCSPPGTKIRRLLVESELVD